ncbi:MAG: bifunctional indole-3-glycerol phosphate synthase/phosphoribosylanthranilate isomerase [Spirochaetales bacterium]|nr:bifunctional indole-3-glycerol phosphate synthase/phosphoribosylanthranilate isomerase [Spirochaetales bacterium]
METDIRAEIALRRAADIRRDGPAQGLSLPEQRTAALMPFPGNPPVICEIKRFSPSVRNINRGLDPVLQAGKYIEAGISNISILTEQNYFGGSLSDLIAVKTAYPEAAVLRKDFLLTPEDVNISYRAGADAFLLIASLLDKEVLEEMYNLGISLGMTPLVELHSPEDIRKARDLRPDLIGINSRDLRIFKIKPLQPLKVRALIDWDCRIIYESGIKTAYDADFVAGTGFDGMLVGESVVRDGAFAGRLAASMSRQPDTRRFSFWKKLYSRSRECRPLVKICGITRREDLLEVKRIGADMAGFILAESPRRVEPSFIESCRDIDILKVGVVVLAKGEDLPPEISALLASGALDAIQFHGDESPDIYLSYPGYKAFRVKDASDLKSLEALPGPAVLVDAFRATARGGTGKRIEADLVRKVARQRSLWLAGGINPDNVYELITEFNPEMIDAASGTEASPGVKDYDRLFKLFNEIDKAQRDCMETADE